MALIGFHASHEQIPPSTLLTVVGLAEEAGFQAAMCSDHFAPWGAAQGNSGHAWTWLGAALQATSLGFGVVTAPGARYHPAITAQAIATLAEMFPGRFWAALGSGEALNEHITGGVWPRKEIRDRRLLESAEVIRRLLAGEEVTHDGLVTVDRAKLWVDPVAPPELFGAAVSAPTARRVGGWADGMITVNQPRETLRQVLGEYREGGGEGKPAYLQVHLSWDEDEQTALAIAHEQWRTNVFGAELSWDLETPAQFDTAAAYVAPDDVRGAVLVSSDLEQHAEWLLEYLELGFDGLYLHHVGQEQTKFIEVFADAVLPELS
ncbi:MAG TPA: TIGR03885 family FMN-dependent LLM class oxidoreductase [Acidimicrobiia bacterium]|nr:TIGR03885 family FMN-dependent LLM class oxidoreductase [Acidimicrobiia bacterium]